MILDVINGAFEASAAALTYGLSVRALQRDKKVRGFHPLPLGLFTLWGFYNLIFYPGSGLWFSFVGGIAVVTVNCAYLYHIWLYRKN